MRLYLTLYRDGQPLPDGFSCEVEWTGVFPSTADMAEAKLALMHAALDSVGYVAEIGDVAYGAEYKEVDDGERD